MTYALLLLAASSCTVAHAEEWNELFKDPEDDRVDGSRWLLARSGFLPVPVLVTEPAVGYGGGVALLFFHGRDEPTTASTAAAPAKFAPPSASGVVLAATENGTKIAGAGHLGIWRDDTLRFTGGIAATSLHLTFYGGEEFPELSEGVSYNLEGWGMFSQLVWRLGASDFWLGPQIQYIDAETAFQESTAAPDRLSGTITNTGAGFVLSYDDRDNIFTPSRGLQSEWDARRHWGWFGEDFEYTRLEGKNRWHFPVASSWVLSARLDVSITDGNVPFYALPSLNQRGIAKMRYQGETAVNTEIETRYDIDGRWFAVAFAGVGRVADAIDELDAVPNRWAGGVGTRYLIARELGLQVGVDVARGPEEWAFYIQAGSAWGL